MIKINDLLIEVKADQSRLPQEKGLLIREMFLLWYALLEGIECENFDESELTRMLRESTENFRKSSQKDGDCLFIVGWGISTSFWVFGDAFGEEEGNKMLIAAYKTQPANVLFKWAIRQELYLTQKEIEMLETELLKNFYHYYNYGPYIKEYFLGVISAPIG